MNGYNHFAGHRSAGHVLFCATCDFFVAIISFLAVFGLPQNKIGQPYYCPHSGLVAFLPGWFNPSV